MLWISGTCGGSKVGRSPGDCVPPWGLGGIPGRVSPRLRVCVGKGSGKQPLRGAVESLATAFTFKCGSLAARANGAWGVGKSVDGSSGNSLAAKGGNEGCLSGRLVRPRRASTAFLIDPGIGTAGGTRHHRHRSRQHRPEITSPSACIPSFPSIPSLPSLDLFDRACLFRSTPCAEQAEQVEQIVGSVEVVVFVGGFRKMSLPLYSY